MREDFTESIFELHTHEPMFQQALVEFLESILPYLEVENASQQVYARLERLLIPDRSIRFKVTWENDNGDLECNSGYRIQFNSALGPYKGGLRFDPSVTEDTLKFLAFEQIFKNALTGLPLGAGKGGSDFDPKGKSDAEVRRFCTAFMGELVKYIGSYTDVPAGDMGVGSREIGYLYGAYKKITERSDGALTGKSVDIGGSEIRTEATGYGAVYFLMHMLLRKGETLEDKRVAVSGSGNVALHVAEKCITEGAKMITISDREGYLYAPDGFSLEFIDIVKDTKDEKRSLASMTLPSGITYTSGKFWRKIEADVYIPAATQNEIDGSDALSIIASGAFAVVEAANMPSTLEAVHTFTKSNVLFAPGKAVNAGGVAVSGLEMTQNAGHTRWTRAEVDAELRTIMERIHGTCVLYGETEDGRIEYIKGANIGGFVRVMNAMERLGW